MKKILVIAVAFAFLALVFGSSAQANPVSGSLWIGEGSPIIITANYSVPKNAVASITAVCPGFDQTQTAAPSEGVQFRHLWYSVWDMPIGVSCSAVLSYSGAKGTFVLDTVGFDT